MVEPQISKNDLKDYAISGVLCVVSFPLAGLYLTRKKDLQSKFYGISAGIILTTALALGTYKQGKENTVFNSHNVQVTHYLSKMGQNNDTAVLLSETILGMGAIFGTNYFTYSYLLNPAEYKSTKVVITGKDGNEKFSCKYDFNNYLDVKDLTFSFPKEVRVGNGYVHGEQGKFFYGGLCKQIFQKKVMEITTVVSPLNLN